MWSSKESNQEGIAMVWTCQENVERECQVCQDSASSRPPVTREREWNNESGIELRREWWGWRGKKELVNVKKPGDFVMATFLVGRSLSERGIKDKF